MSNPHDTLLDEIRALITARTGNADPLVLLHVMDRSRLQQQHVAQGGRHVTGLAICMTNMHPDLVRYILQHSGGAYDVARELNKEQP